MITLRNILPKSSFARDVVTLAAGTGIAQAIPILVSPILTRLYSPSDFGTFALYTAFTAIVAVIVTGRYELAIALPKKDQDAVNILALSIFLSITIGLLLLALVAPAVRLLGDRWLPHLDAALLWAIPCSAIIIGIYQSLNYWSNRKGQYRRMSLSRVLQGMCVVLGQLLAGYLVGGHFGLISGQIVGQLVSLVVLLLMIWREDRNLLRDVTPGAIKRAAVGNASFPTYLILGQLANVASAQMPLFLLSSFYGSAVTGFYALSQRTLAVPMTLVGGAIGDVFRRRAAISYNESGNCRAIFIQTAKRLAGFGLLPVLPLFFWGGDTFQLVFGPSWRMAGEICSILSVMVFFQTISSPLSQTVLFAGMQAGDLIWQIARFVLSIAALYAGYLFFGNPKISIAFHAGVFSVLYVIHSLMQYRAACGRPASKKG